MTSLVREVDRAIAEENRRYLAWAKAHPEEAAADIEREAVLLWRSLGWCERCGSPDHSTDGHQRRKRG